MGSCEDLSVHVQGKGLDTLQHSSVMHVHIGHIIGDHISVIKPHVTCLMAVLGSARPLSIKYLRLC